LIRGVYFIFAIVLGNDLLQQSVHRSANPSLYETKAEEATPASETYLANNLS
jgi:hypothetical protein